MKKKSFMFLVLVLVVALALSACSGNSGSGTANKNDPNAVAGEASFTDEDGNGVADWQEKPIDLTFALSFYGEEDDLNIMYLNIKKFMKKYPNIKVTRDPQFRVITNKDFEDLEILTARAMEGTLPDILYSPMSAEMYDRELVLDLTPYLNSDPDAKWISENARKAVTTYDGKAIYGLPWQSVAQFPVLNLKLLRENNIAIPPYNWTYEDYEHLRSEVAKLTPNQPVFPGMIDFIEIGTHYFDSVPNGWKGFNSETGRFDYAGAPNFGKWLDMVSNEGKEGLHFWDLPEEDRKKKVGDLSNPWADGLEAVGNVWMYSLHFDVNDLIKNRNMEIDIYPMPKAPEGGTTSVRAYYDTLSLSSALVKDPVKAEAAYQLLKWLTYDKEGLMSRWSLIDEFSGLPKDAPLRAEDKLMDFIMGWPVTTDPEILKHHPLVKGFPEDSELAIFNFQAFQNVEFQQMLANPVPYPRNFPGVAKAFATLNPWEIRNDIRDEGKKYSDIAPEWDALLNKTLDDFLREFNSQ